MNFASLPDDWPDQRASLQRLATHVLAQSRARVDGMFDLVPLPGGFGTPPVGPRRRRVRISGGSLLVEEVAGSDMSDVDARTSVTVVPGSSLRSLCAVAGFVPDPDFRVGDDTPHPGDLDAPITLASGAAEQLGDWYLLGQRAIDVVLTSIPNAMASVGRLWPEHFDYGIDLAVDATRDPDRRCNLGAAAGDDFHAEPYLYVGPWGPQRPGPAAFWNAPFGAVATFGDLDAADEPLGAAIEFFLRGIAALRS